MNKKGFLADLLHATGVLALSRPTLTSHNNILPILAYHRVKPLTSDYAFDEELISATPEDFLWQMQHIKTHYSPIRLADIALYTSSKLPWPKRPVIITFDDGFDDNYHYAYPILKQLNIPATIFLTTDYIGSDKVFWFDWVIFLLKKLSTTVNLTTSDGGKRFLLIPSRSLQQQTDLFGFLKSISDAERLNIIIQLESAAEVTHSNVALAASQAMDWDSVIEMSASGWIDFGSHTQSHPALNQLNRDALIYELQGSKHIIETKTGKPCNTFAYPFGGDDITTPDVIAQVKQAGYAYACMYQKAYSHRNALNNVQLERLHIERDINHALFASILALPNVFAF
jgi:peptidoglycan/xylan/chitin deacetylase (PgdA/CDA1 family)